MMRTTYARCGVDCFYGDDTCNYYCCGDASLPPEIDQPYAALNRQIEAAAFEVRQLKYQIAYLTQERDDWKDKAVEISHALTYYSEQVNHSGLRLVRDPEADGPVPEMFK